MVHFSLIVPFSFLVITFLVATFVVATPVPSPTITSISIDGSKYPNLSCVNSSDCQWIDGICDDGVCVCLDRFDSAKNVCVNKPQPSPGPQSTESAGGNGQQAPGAGLSILAEIGLAILVLFVLPVTVVAVCFVTGCAWCAYLGFCRFFQATSNFGQPEEKNQGPGGLKTGTSSGGTNSDGPSSTSGKASSLPTSTQA